MNGISEVMKGGISAILIAVGYLVLVCGIFCLLGSAFGTGDGGGILGCAFGCIIYGPIQIASGIVWYHMVKPKSQATP